MIATGHRNPSVEELEALWALSPYQPEGRPRRAFRLPPVPGRALVLAWVVFLVAAVALEPAPNPAAATPLWAELAGAAFLLSLLTAVLAGLTSARLGFGLATAAGCLGIALSVACSATGHHLGSWWLAELGGTGALTALAATGLAARLRSG